MVQRTVAVEIKTTKATRQLSIFTMVMVFYFPMDASVHASKADKLTRNDLFIVNKQYEK